MDVQDILKLKITKKEQSQKLLRFEHWHDTGRCYSLELSNSSILTSCGIFVYIMCNLAYSFELWVL